MAPEEFIGEEVEVEQSPGSPRPVRFVRERERCRPPSTLRPLPLTAVLDRDTISGHTQWTKGGLVLARVKSAAVFGIDAYPIEVEVDVSSGLPTMVVVGLPDTAVKEARDRVKAAIRNAGYFFPARRITVNLAPADVKKEGPLFDLPIALGLLRATDQLSTYGEEEYAVVGELALDGRVRPVNGVLSMAMELRGQGMKGFLVAAENAAEAGVVTGLEIIPVETLGDAVGFFNGALTIDPYELELEEVFREEQGYEVDFVDVKGQAHAKRALTVAAAGAHNVIMIGPPGSGKTMLARRLPTILPNLTLEESLETTRLYSVAGLLARGKSLLATRPFRSPHHTISSVALVGGGTVPRPGEISLAHHGVLFLDELPEFQRATLEAMRQPVEDGTVTVSRAAGTVTFPARLMLVAALNPCPCGYYTDPHHECHCTPTQIRNYLKRISGPLLDRIDIHVDVPPVRLRELTKLPDGESSAEIREQVEGARAAQRDRFKRAKIFTNAQMTNRHIKRYCALQPPVQSLLEQAMTELRLSARAYYKILKVARTIADLAGSPTIETPHIAEAVQYRSLDRSFWT